MRAAAPKTRLHRNRNANRRVQKRGLSGLWVPPPEGHPIFAKYLGRRQDIESHFGTLKSRLPDRRLNFCHEASLISKGIGINHKFVNIATLAYRKRTGADCTHIYGNYHQLGPEVFGGFATDDRIQDIRAGP